MVDGQTARRWLAPFGTLRPQPANEWTGAFPLPIPVAQFYVEVGPWDVSIEGHGNPYFFPRLADLWKFQTGYRWHGFTGEPLPEWDDDWLVIADEGGDPFIFSRSSGAVLFALHGAGCWEPQALFPNLNALAACLGLLGQIAADAGPEFWNEDCTIRPQCVESALGGLQKLLGSAAHARRVLDTLAWH